MKIKKSSDLVKSQQTILSAIFSSKSLSGSQVKEVKGGRGPMIDPMG